ncbi:MAG: flavodoxin [Patescibacteria group bacterium]|nr:MAG: flavodoxin [Patescibacteria group bacterium]
MKIAVTFSTLSGNTALVANDLIEYLENKGHETKLFDAMNVDADQLKEYELVFFGSSTYGDGELNPITEIFLSTADQKNHNCNNTHFAFFSLGDSSYPIFSSSGTLSSERIAKMHGNIIEPILQIDGYPNQDTFQKCKQWAETILDQMK